MFLLLGFSPILSVFWATVVAFAALLPRPRERARAAPARHGAEGRLGADAERRGDLRGGRASSSASSRRPGSASSSRAIVIDYAGGSLPLTALYTALIVWVIGLAVPVTASYIICAVIAAPALTKLGVPDYAAHMFIFYYAVLSEVSPPTALSPFAAAAITGGDPYRTTLQSWKYTLPAFVVPFVFVLSPDGVGLLLKTPPDGIAGSASRWSRRARSSASPRSPAACRAGSRARCSPVERAVAGRSPGSRSSIPRRRGDVVGLVGGGSRCAAIRRFARGAGPRRAPNARR